MASSYYSAGPGQSGSVQSVGGAIAGFDSGNQDNISPTYYSDIINNKSKQYARLIKPADITSAYNAFKARYGANDALAKQNADYYTNLAKGILSNNTSTADTYERLRSGNLSSLSDTFKNVLDYGLSSQKARLAAGGYGGSGPSAYDRILNSTVTASNISPVLNTIYGNLGRDATSAIGGDRAWDSYRMDQFSKDPLTAYADANAYRAITPLGVQRGLINNDVNTMSNLLRGVIIPNVSGYELDPGLSTKLNNFASGTMNLSRFGGELMSTYGGAMGGGGGGGLGSMMGGGGGTQPQGATTTTNGYPNSVGYDVPQAYTGAPYGISYDNPGRAPVNYYSNIGLNDLPATGGYNQRVSY